MHIENPEAVGNPGQTPIIVPDTSEEAEAFRRVVENNRRALGMPPQALAEVLAEAVADLMRSDPDEANSFAMCGDLNDPYQHAIQHAIEEAWQKFVPKGAELVSKEWLARAHERTERIREAVSVIRKEPAGTVLDTVLTILLDISSAAPKATEGQA